VNELDLISEFARQERARRSFSYFCARMDTRFASPPKFMQLMMDEFADLESGRNRFLSISIPPRHSKTTTGSVLLPIFALGRNPALEIVLASHSIDLAERNSRMARDLIQSDAWPFTVKLAKDSTAATRWHVEGGGSVRALGVGSALLGRGADLLVVDDPIADANSEAEAEAVWDWFHSASSRLNKGGKIAVIGQRLRDNDLIGRIIESEIGPQFRVLNLLAICENEDDPTEQRLGRKNGDALWPEQFSLDELRVRRQLMGSRAFESQFQGRPVSSTGGIFQRKWFENRWTALPEPEPVNEESAIEARMLAARGFVNPLECAKPRRFIKVQGIDAASKTGILNDYSVIVTLIYDGAAYYVVDLVRDKLEFSDLNRAIVDAYTKHRPMGVYIEDASAGTAALQALRKFSRVPVIPVPTGRSSKSARAEAVSPLFEGGRVLLPQHAPWLEEYIDEFAAFPGRHDDMVDATVIAITMAGKVASRRRETAQIERVTHQWIAR
jgi:predicted phage terminase large subunit-like protein